MRSFLVKDKKPIIQWSALSPNTHYIGLVPEGFALAINPSENIIVLDVDVDEPKGKNGFLNIPETILWEIECTYNYKTKRGGLHAWFYYSGTKELMNKASNLSIDLRIGQKLDNNGNTINNGGYCIYYPANQGDNIFNHIHEFKETSTELNEWLEKLFC